MLGPQRTGAEHGALTKQSSLELNLLLLLSFSVHTGGGEWGGGH